MEEITTNLYWDCECVDNYIHPKEKDYCDKCNTSRDEQPDSLKNEVILLNLPL